MKEGNSALPLSATQGLTGIKKEQSKAAAFKGRQRSQEPKWYIGI